VSEHEFSCKLHLGGPDKWFEDAPVCILDEYNRLVGRAYMWGSSPTHKVEQILPGRANACCWIASNQMVVALEMNAGTETDPGILEEAAHALEQRDPSCQWIADALRAKDQAEIKALKLAKGENDAR